MSEMVRIIAFALFLQGANVTGRKGTEGWVSAENAYNERRLEGGKPNYYEYEVV